MKIKIDFKKEPLGSYTEEQINKNWNNPGKIIGKERCSIVKKNGKKVLQVKYAKNIVGMVNGGVQWRMNFGRSFDELYLQYKIMFERGFNFVKGGKLPGLSGGSNPGGGADSSKGFSARIMWRENGQIEQYVYHPGREGNWGRDLFFHNLSSKNLELMKFKPGVWHTVKTKIKIKNEFSWKNEGYIVSWLDGKLAIFQAVKLKEWEEKYGIDNLNFCTFFGGNTPEWAPIKEEKVYFKEIIISEKDIK